MSADDLAKILDELGQRLGPTGEHVFALAVRQQLIEGWLSVGGGIVLLVLSVLGAIVLSRRTYDFEWLFAGIPAIVAAIFIAFGLPQLLNPEYAAIRDLLRAVGR